MEGFASATAPTRESRHRKSGTIFSKRGYNMVRDHGTSRRITTQQGFPGNRDPPHGGLRARLFKVQVQGCDDGVTARRRMTANKQARFFLHRGTDTIRIAARRLPTRPTQTKSTGAIGTRSADNRYEGNSWISQPKKNYTPVPKPTCRQASYTTTATVLAKLRLRLSGSIGMRIRCGSGRL